MAEKNSATEANRARALLVEIESIINDLGECGWESEISQMTVMESHGPNGTSVRYSLGIRFDKRISL